MAMTPVILTIAGSDSGGGAGIQADMRAIAAQGCFACTAITAVTAQNPDAVTGVWTIPTEGIREQIRAVRRAFPVAAIKTGMLADAAIIAAVCDELADYRGPLVVDPVMVATSGSVLLDPQAVATLRARLLPMARIITPNLPEANVLLGRPVTDGPAAARELAAGIGTAVLLKGGHNLGAGMAVDYLALPDGSVETFSAPIIAARSTHGTGCTLAAALAAALGSGHTLSDAVQIAKNHVSRALANCLILSDRHAALGS